jgi:hypothetical protein
MTISMVKIWAILHGNFVKRFGPSHPTEEQRSVKTGSKGGRSQQGNSTRKHADPNQVRLVRKDVGLMTGI